MWKELAKLAETATSWPIFLILLVFGGLGFWRISDKKANQHLERDTRKNIQLWSGRLIGAAIILALANFVLKVVSSVSG